MDIINKLNSIKSTLTDGNAEAVSLAKTAYRQLVRELEYTSGSLDIGEVGASQNALLQIDKGQARSYNRLVNEASSLVNYSDAQYKMTEYARDLITQMKQVAQDSNTFYSTGSGDELGSGGESMMHFTNLVSTTTAIDVGDLAANIFDGDFTIEARIQADTLTASTNPRIVSFGTSFLNPNSVVLRLKETGAIWLQFGDGAGALSSMPSNAGVITAGREYSVAVTYTRATRTATFYVDGASAGSAVMAANPTSVVRTVSRLSAAASGYSWLGYMGDVRIWSDVRTQTEIQQNLGKRLVGNEGNLEAYWKLDETSGSTVADSSGHGYTGTVLSTAYVSPSFRNNKRQEYVQRFEGLQEQFANLFNGGATFDGMNLFNNSLKIATDDAGGGLNLKSIDMSANQATVANLNLDTVSNSTSAYTSLSTLESTLSGLMGQSKANAAVTRQLSSMLREYTGFYEKVNLSQLKVPTPERISQVLDAGKLLNTNSFALKNFLSVFKNS